MAPLPCNKIGPIGGPRGKLQWPYEGPKSEGGEGHILQYKNNIKNKRCAYNATAVGSGSQGLISACTSLLPTAVGSGSRGLASAYASLLPARRG
jgi:hypothetical protein